MTTDESGTAQSPSPERAALLSALAKHRWLFTATLTDLSDEQAAARTTVSELCLGGLVKHVADTEDQWVRFVHDGPAAFSSFEDTDWQARADSFRLLPGETVAGVLADYAAVAARTDEAVRTVDLDRAFPLPEAPWFAPEEWSARRVFLHLLAEVSQHAGHADVLREAVDGRKSMG
ncbi:DinB family protein [Kineococcus sp. NPDC059986]|uniref:DinB family protein n=1 Tax=Kineococcus sp. NPDC059986 TaxID=3155538 RepID=UPI00344D5A94